MLTGCNQEVKKVACGSGNGSVLVACSSGNGSGTGGVW